MKDGEEVGLIGISINRGWVGTGTLGHLVNNFCLGVCIHYGACSCYFKLWGRAQ